MIKFSSLLKRVYFLSFGIILSFLFLSSCSSPTKYTPREPLVHSNSHQSMPRSAMTPSNKINHDLGSIASESLIGTCGASYQVKSGDSLSEIARFCGVSMHQIAKMNKISPPYTIYKNQRLQLPQKEAQAYSRVEMVLKPTEPFKKTPLKSEELPEKLPEILIKKVVKHSEWQWPVHQNLPYRFIRDGAGLSVVEIYGVAGQNIYAVASGSIVYSGEGIIDFGKMLVIKHDDDYMSVYAHNNALLVKEGDRVTAGQHIAYLGATGNASQPKLYLEARFQGRKIDLKKVLSSPN
ncbi:hypothetical protein MNBD_GAMMA03-1633 [hydrothermal vent metagenome]|uniref:LysM domain-containing protein n=1 Tax=hydrothermal vent metagenome TaxID=652676 RepID=A0A3B0VSZ1_9ZZZZ